MSQGANIKPPRAPLPTARGTATPAPATPAPSHTAPPVDEEEDSIEIQEAGELPPASGDEDDDFDAIDRFGPSEEGGVTQGTVVASIPLSFLAEEAKVGKEKGASIASTQIEPLPLNVSSMIEFEESKEQRFQLTKTVTVIGRAAGAADLVLPWNEEASRQHCAILYSQRTFFLEDLKSSNGTFVNDKQVERVRLQSGDKIRIGVQVLVFRYRM